VSIFLKMWVFGIAPHAPILCHTATTGIWGTPNCAQKEVTPTTTTTAARQQRLLPCPAHQHAQGPNIPFGGHPSL